MHFCSKYHQKKTQKFYKAKAFNQKKFIGKKK